MTQYRLQAGMTLDIPSREDIGHEVDQALTRWDHEERVRLRGIKPMRVSFNLGSTPTKVFVASPASGYAWNLKMVTGLLSGADSVAAYVGDDSTDVPNQRILGYAAPVSVTGPAQGIFTISWSSNQGLLFPNEGIVLATSGAFRFTNAMLYATQVPAEMIGKLLGGSW